MVYDGGNVKAPSVSKEKTIEEYDASEKVASQKTGWGTFC